MKLKYDRAEDILTIETTYAGTIDHAEQTGSLIAHFSDEGKLLVLEILDASEFLASFIQVAVRGQEKELPAVAA